ncbi:MAG: hypothetical protein E6J41_26705 [Chloroflexi bacterium]|nr:MAG: hypothetical protein E6J41_26705 [Chloroflexota bacterium]
MNHAIAVAGALIGAGLALGGGAIGAAVIMFIIIGLVEAMYFINLALGFYFITAVANGVS